MRDFEQNGAGLAGDQALAAIGRAQAVIRFSAEGLVVDANRNFLSAMGYELGQIVGQHHRMFVDPKEAALPDYAAFWAALRRGEAQSGEFRRVARGGREVWLNASYAPICDAAGRVTGVVKFALDITAAKRAALDAEDQLRVLSASQAVIEFRPDGTIVSANDNFLSLMGYQLSELKGAHHAIFVSPQEAASPDYRQFWADLRAGKSRTGEFQRVSRSGSPVWINGSYASVRDSSGAVRKVVKFATDITARKVLVEELVTALEALSSGDMTCRLSSRVTGEFEGLRGAFNDTLARLAALVQRIGVLGHAMDSDAALIAAGAQDLARRGETQAAALEESSAAISQISGNLRDTSRAAAEADTLAAGATSKAREGEGIVGAAIAAMESIEIHTRKMAEMTTVIENFALQTNLLSINAAVEAARAGEVGRGFAVVAAEVRNLAQQSAKASQTIAELIGKSTQDVRRGVESVRGAGGALTDINAAVSQMALSVNGIARATREQVAGIEAVSQSLGHLDHITHENQRLSDRNAQAAQRLETHMQELTDRISVFKAVEEADTAEDHRQVA